jgi:Mrp family chromosome partitioning ATPase
MIGRTDSKFLQDDNIESLPCFPLDEVYVFKAATRGMQKEIIGLYHNINARLSNASTKTIQFIASQPAEGTSTISREFARFVSGKLRKSVYLLDANTDRSQRSNISITRQEHRIQPEADSRNATVKAVYERAESLSVVCPISMLGSSLTSMFSSSHIDRYMGNLKQYFDFILIDSPPLSTSADGLASIQKVDGIILIVDAENTRWPVAKNTKDTIVRARGQILGLILNKRKYYIPRFIYRQLY